MLYDKGGFFVANQNFRTALHGFHRDDVVQFIEVKTLEHEKALREKNDEIARLQGELDDMKLQLDLANAEVDKLHEELSAAPSAPAAPAAQPQQPEETAQAQTSASALEAPMPPVGAAMPQSPPVSSLSEMELAAYRRAELAERHARERASSVYQQIQSVFDQSCAKITNSNQDLDTLVETLRSNAQTLLAALNTVRGVYVETSDAFRAVGDASFDEANG